MKAVMKKLVPDFLLGWYHQFWPFFGAVVYGFPGGKIKVIGITGTNGKTTVTHLATDILEEAGYKVASISSLRFKIGDKEWKNELKMTMPGRMKVQKFLRQAVDAGCEYVVMEVTSEGIKQHRHKFINFDVAVFTNLTPEHIESHGGFKKYRIAKGELFKGVRVSIINLDDESAGYFLEFEADKKYGFKITKRGQTPQAGSDPEKLICVEATDINLHNNGVDFSVKDNNFNLRLLGKFNIYNSLAAICVGLSQGIDINVIKHALEGTRGIPGRMETVVKEPFTVIVDYAHTPDALEKVYKTMKESGTKNLEPRMICVLGAAGGGRDKWKRPELGRIAAQYCDSIILTDEDPYNEDPAKIIKDIKDGIPDSQFRILNFTVELDRREAIKKALQDAKPGDIVVITGKGAEPWIMTKEGKIPWDDRGIVRELS